jgi:beta-lactamase superfamily II metal-dependent hydrolase
MFTKILSFYTKYFAIWVIILGAIAYFYPAPFAAANDYKKLLFALPAAAKTNGSLDIYWTDVEGGAATLIVTPAGESILIDTGLPGDRDPVRIVDTIKNKAHLNRIDHLVITHFDGDHYGGTADIAKMLPIKKIYDPGLPTENEKTMSKLDPYLEAAKGKRKILRPGDIIQLKQLKASPPLEIKCLAAAQKFISSPTSSPTNNICDQHKPKGMDLSENANSIVLLITFGDFKFLDAADLTWNLEKDLVCPTNLVGTVDVFQVNHHGLDQSNNPVLIGAIQPTVAVMNNGHKKGCQPETFKTLTTTPSIKALYQLHRNLFTGPEGNTDPKRIANMEEKCNAEIIKLSVTGDSKKYTVSIPTKSFSETFKTKASPPK